MASSSITTLVFFACCFLLFSFSDNLVAGDSDKVQLNLYYESLSPSCQDFIVNDLFDFFYTDLYKITNVTFVPFGNATLSDNQTITCENGEVECELNKVEACIIKTIPDPQLQYSLIRSIENDTNTWQSSSSFNASKSEEAIIGDCYISDLSTKLMLGYANQTLSLNPKPAHLPWVTLNGKPIYEETQNIGEVVGQVCKAYKGTASLPTLCNPTALAERKVWSKPQVSYASEAINY